MTETINDPRFVCTECGFANVMLDDDGAYCTSCGTQYTQANQ